jgi:hypothetical protein
MALEVPVMPTPRLATLLVAVVAALACAADGGGDAPMVDGTAAPTTGTEARPPADAPGADQDGESAEEPADDAVVTDAVGTVHEVGAGSGRWSLVPDDDPGQRYAPDELPEAFRVEGLRVVFSGEVGEIPPNVRMWGTPLHLTAIRRLEEAPGG